MLDYVLADHRLGLGLGAAFAVELERVLALRGGDAFEAGEEVDVPESAAELAVGDRLQAGCFLQRHRFSDGFVFQFSQGCREILPS